MSDTPADATGTGIVTLKAVKLSSGEVACKIWIGDELIHHHIYGAWVTLGYHVMGVIKHALIPRGFSSLLDWRL